MQKPVEGWGRADSLVEDVSGGGVTGMLSDRAGRRIDKELEERWPQLVPGLCAHPGIGFVAGLDRDGAPWALGAHGRHNLADGTVQGVDPLAPFEAHAPRVLARAVLMPESPDLYLNSNVHPLTLDAAAFEELVDAHGGLGGYQDSAVLLVPSDLAQGLPDRIEGADELHDELVAMLEACGQRTSLVPSSPDASRLARKSASGAGSLAERAPQS